MERDVTDIVKEAAEQAIGEGLSPAIYDQMNGEEKVTHTCGCTVTYFSDDPDATTPPAEELCWRCQPCAVCAAKDTPGCPDCDPFEVL